MPEWDRIDGKYPVFGSGGLTGTHNKSLVPGPGIIVGRAGTIGPDSIYFSDNDFCPIETTYYVKARQELSAIYVFHLLKQLTIVNTGSSVPNLSRRDMHRLEIIIPPQVLVNKFERFARPLFKKIYLNNETNYKLEQISKIIFLKFLLGHFKK